MAAAMDTRLRDANSHLGVFSTYAVSDARELFWRTASAGGQFVQRQTWWDIVFGLLFRGVSWGSLGRSDDGSAILQWFLDMVWRVIVNVFVSVFAVVVTFLVSVWSVIMSYRPSAVEAAVFFVGATLAALACACSTCLGCCAAGTLATAPAVYAARHTAAVRRLRFDADNRDRVPVERVAHGAGGLRRRFD
jgi:hypothetical protein